MSTHESLERWLPIPGWEAYYLVSDQGRVRSLPRVIMRWNGSPLTIRGRIMRPATPSQAGYWRVNLMRDGVHHTRLVHTLVAETFLGPKPERMEVCHGDGNPRNNNLTNLRYDTSAANKRDTVKHGRHPEAKKTHCPQGHPYSPENTYIQPKKGARNCRTCAQERSNAVKAARPRTA